MGARGTRQWIPARRLPLALAAAQAIVVGAGCASLPPCPAKGGPTWRAFTSEHFVLRSDLGVDDAVDTVRTLEETRSAMLGGMWGGATGPTEPIQVIVFAARSELTAFLGFDLVGLHRDRPPFPPLLVFSGAYHDGGSTAKHELAHHLSRHFVPLQPDWYAEGLASYLETTEYDHALGRATLGKPDERLYQLFRHISPLSLDALLGRTPMDPQEMPRFYATSWLLVHYLMNHREQQFRSFQRRLGKLEPASQAFRAEFPDLDRDGLPRVLMNYVDGGRYATLSGTTPAWTSTPRSRVLSDAEVHGVRALLYATVSERDDQDTLGAARGEIDEALRASPTSVEAMAVASYVPQLHYPVDRATLAKQAIAADRGNWMAWLMTFDAANASDSASLGALLKASELAPGNLEVRARLAIWMASEGRWNDALAHSNNALAAGALRPRFLILHLRALLETGHCPQAALWRAALEGYLTPGEDDARFLATQATRPCLPNASAAPPMN